MKEYLDFYCNEFISEWDEELAELITVSDLSDIFEHKDIIIPQLVEVLEMYLVMYKEGEAEITDVTNVSDTIKWISGAE